MLTPIKKKRVSDMAIEQINQLISAGHLKPGDTLPSERKLMEKFKISRVPVREALRVLEMMGVVEVKPGRGIYVTDPENSLFSPLRQWLSVQKETLVNHFEVRLLIEPRAAAFCAERASKEQIKAMKKCLRSFFEAQAENKLVDMIRADTQLHQLIAEATGNRTLATLMSTFTNSLLEGWKASLRTEGRGEKTVEEHATIVEAIEKKDGAKAEKLMKNHLLNALSDLKRAGL
ncbi:MAG: FadR family transcriptional regulator [Deltaproteobacteria bacterium]|nr:FadR family transcriptional regulator [Deltaproteobacteria bacterium]